jgi:hypothetical protein
MRLHRTKDRIGIPPVELEGYWCFKEREAFKEPLSLDFTNF